MPQLYRLVYTNASKAVHTARRLIVGGSDDADECVVFEEVRHLFISLFNHSR